MRRKLLCQDSRNCSSFDEGPRGCVAVRGHQALLVLAASEHGRSAWSFETVGEGSARYFLDEILVRVRSREKRATRPHHARVSSAAGVLEPVRG